MTHSTTSVRTYLGIYAVLIGLTLLTVTLALNAQLKQWEVPVALGIATVKTVLVGLYFMHLLHTPRFIWLILLIGVLFLVGMVGLILLDYWTRAWVLG